MQGKCLTVISNTDPTKNQFENDFDGRENIICWK